MDAVILCMHVPRYNMDVSRYNIYGCTYVQKSRSNLNVELIICYPITPLPAFCLYLINLATYNVVQNSLAVDRSIGPV